MSRVWGCLGPCLECRECGGDGTCHCRVPLWAPPSQEGLNRPWDECIAQFIPGSTGIQVFPSVFAPAGCSGEECAPLGYPCCRVIPGRQTDRVLKIKLKEDCKWQKSWRQDFQRAQFVRKTAAFYSMPGMADGRDIWHFALIEWQVGRRQQRYCKQITREVELGSGRIWGKLCSFGWTPWLIHSAWRAGSKVPWHHSSIPSWKGKKKETQSSRKISFLPQGSSFLRLSELPVSSSPPAMRQRRIRSLGETHARTRVEELQGGRRHFWGPCLFHWAAIGEKMGWYMRGIKIKAVIPSPWLRRTQPWLKCLEINWDGNRP